MSFHSRIEKHFLYLLCVLVMIVGTLFIAVSNNLASTFWSSFLRSFGLAMWPTAAIAIVFEYYLQHRWTEQIRRSLSTDLSVRLNELGITRIYRNRDEWGKERVDLYQNAKNVKYLAVAPNMKGGGEKMITMILSLLKEGVNFQFLVCHPDNPFATQYYGFSATDTGMAPFKEEIWASIERLKTIQARTKRGWGKVQFRIYKNSPGCYLQIIDEVVYFQPYFYGSRGGVPFMIKLERGFQRNLLVTHFDEIWRNAITIGELEASSS